MLPLATRVPLPQFVCHGFLEVAKATFPTMRKLCEAKIAETKHAIQKGDFVQQASAVSDACDAVLGAMGGDCTDAMASLRGAISKMIGFDFDPPVALKKNMLHLFHTITGRFVEKGGVADDEGLIEVLSLISQFLSSEQQLAASADFCAEIQRVADMKKELQSAHGASPPAQPCAVREKSRALSAQLARVAEMGSPNLVVTAVHKFGTELASEASTFLGCVGKHVAEQSGKSLESFVTAMVDMATVSKGPWPQGYKGPMTDFAKLAEFAKKTLLSVDPKQVADSISLSEQALRSVPHMFVVVARTHCTAPWCSHAKATENNTQLPRHTSLASMRDAMSRAILQGEPSSGACGGS